MMSRSHRLDRLVVVEALGGAPRGVILGTGIFATKRRVSAPLKPFLTEKQNQEITRAAIVSHWS
jgi:hypothetical protein